MAANSEVFPPAIVALGFDILAIKRYWLAVVILWIYDYFLTLSDEIKYMWSRKKTLVFWMFLSNRYLAVCGIIITLISFFDLGWTPDVCRRCGFMEPLETMAFTHIAESILAIRVYVLSGKSKIVPIVCGLIIFAQWAIVLYLTIYSFEGSNQVALLLSPPIYPLPTIPAIDAYNICLFIATRGMAVPTYPSNPFMEAWLCLSLTYETIIFLSISYLTLKMSGLRFSVNSLTSIVNIIQRDSILYFLVLFFSSLAWLILLLHAPPGLKFTQNQPGTLFYSIMVNRITLNLKGVDDRDKDWTIELSGTSGTIVFRSEPRQMLDLYLRH